MIKIGGAWVNTSENGNEYISEQIAPELLEGGFRLTPNLIKTLHQNKDKTDEKQPDYHVCVSLKTKKEQNT